jgi:hypothetical protein
MECVSMRSFLHVRSAIVQAIGFTALLAAACADGSGGQTSPTGISPLGPSVLSGPVLAAQGGRANTALVCHLRGHDRFALLSVSPSAVGAHLGHGDGLPGGAVPGMAGYVFDNSCAPQRQADLLTCPCWNTFSQNSLAVLVNGLQVQACSANPFGATILTSTETLTISLTNPNGGFCGGPGKLASVTQAEGLACLSELKSLIPLIPRCQLSK